MKKSVTIALLLLFAFFGVIFITTTLQAEVGYSNVGEGTVSPQELQTEINYPNIGGGTIPPQELQRESIDSSFWFSYFMAYVFRFLLILSFSIIAITLIYGALLYLLSSRSTDFFKVKVAKEWIMGAMRGAFLILFAVILLSFIGDQFVLFRQIELREQSPIGDHVGLNWEIRNIYFQIPVGLLVEDAILNNTAKKKLDDVLVAAKKAEKTANSIEEGNRKLMRILDECPEDATCCDGDRCCGGPTTGDPHNVYGNSIDIITAKVYLDHSLYTFVDLGMGPFSSYGVVRLNPSEIMLEKSIPTIGGIKLYGEDRIGTEMALRIAVGYSSNDIEYGTLSVSCVGGVVGRFVWNNDVPFCIGEDENTVVGRGLIYINPRFSFDSEAPGKGFIEISGGSARCPENTIWSKDERGWLLRCGNDCLAYYNALPENIKNTITHTNYPEHNFPPIYPIWTVDRLVLCPNDDMSSPTEPWALSCAEDCGVCPTIQYRVNDTIDNIEKNMRQLEEDMEYLLMTKEPLKEELYQLYKIYMLKSLGKEEVMGYSTYLTDRYYYERNQVAITTDTEKTEVGEYLWDWGRWIENITYNVLDINNEPVEENDPTTIFLKRMGTNHIISEALEKAKEKKEEGIQRLGKRERNEEDTTSLQLEENKAFTVIRSLAKNILNFVKKNINLDIVIEAENKDGIFEECLKNKITGTGEGKSEEEKIEECFIGADQCLIENNLSADFFLEFYKKNIEIFYSICKLTPPEDAGDYLSCGLEIPMGETIDLTWNHLMAVLKVIDDYIEQGRILLEEQEVINMGSYDCGCYCSGPGGNPGCPAEPPEIPIRAIAPDRFPVNAEEMRCGEIKEKKECVDDSDCASPYYLLFAPWKEYVCGDKGLCDCPTPGPTHCNPSTCCCVCEADNPVSCCECGGCVIGCDREIIRCWHERVLLTREQMKKLVGFREDKRVCENIVIKVDDGCNEDFPIKRDAYLCVDNAEECINNNNLCCCTDEERNKHTCDENNCFTFYESINILTAGHFTPISGLSRKIYTENLCHPLNADIRSEEESEVCKSNACKCPISCKSNSHPVCGCCPYITKHELITRKLNYSRREIDMCLNTDLEGILVGDVSEKVLLYSPIVEHYDIPRATKKIIETSDGINYFSTSEFNWFCCSTDNNEE